MNGSVARENDPRKPLKIKRGDCGDITMVERVQIPPRPSTEVFTWSRITPSVQFFMIILTRFK